MLVILMANFSATFDEFEEVDKRTPLKDGRRNQLWTAVLPKTKASD